MDATTTQRVQELSLEGLSIRRIAAQVGVGRMAVARALKPEAYRDIDRRRNRKTLSDTSQSVQCADCGKPCWRSKRRVDGTSPKYPKGHAQRCLECRGPWTREKGRVVAERRKMRQREAYVEDVIPTVVFDRDKWRCHLCKKRVSRKLAWPDPMSVSLDHVIPLAHGGEHSYANTRCAHLRCNIIKGARMKTAVQLALC